MDRKEKILKHIDPKGRGLEIGPSYNPLAPKCEGFNVEIIDHLGRKDLVRKYSDEAGADTARIEEVDYIWNGEPYAELTGRKDWYDWIIASHLVEHTPDLIGFLNSCDAVLKESGVIALAVPDKRYCFDHFRPLTSIAVLIDSYLDRSRVHTPGRIVEYYLNVVDKGGLIAWDEHWEGEFELKHSAGEAVQRFDTARKEPAYTDIHAWCFVPHSFRLIIHDLNMLGLIPFKEVDFFLTEGCEFHIILGREGGGIGISRLEMMKIIEDEMAAVI